MTSSSSSSFLSLVIAIIFCSILTFVVDVEAVDFTLELHPSGQKKCFGEELSKGTLLVCEIEAPAGSSLAMTVADPSATIFSDKDLSHIKTAFTTNQSGTHQFCVHNTGRKSVIARLGIRWGAQARDYSAIAKKEHLDMIETNMSKLHEELFIYHNVILYMREAEQGLRKKTDAMAMRVIAFTCVNVVLILAVGLFQILYFRRFFKSKKLI